ncbi:HvfC/BufC family peptide modification chaperone [Microvirga sp. G4-2]|uniref:HvfC/BufC family peptide modification chaperone n=1 Tax=Microvirga sp. G4-2 TaxID=3434467 RepID=UPI004043A09E
MPSLADVQTWIRDAVVLGAIADVAPLLVGGGDPIARLAIHRRHYEASLVEAILRRFPGVVWLAGETFTRAAAADFVRWFPPAAPCIAEYAEHFPDFLARCVGTEQMPYVQWFARLEWHLGQVALAIDEPPLHVQGLAAFEPAVLPDLVLGLQGGLRFLEAPWPVDDLAMLHLTGAAPDRFVLQPTAVWLQVRGARGSIRIDRLDPGTFAFRSAIAQGLPLGGAAEQALDSDPAFDPGGALTSLLADDLAISVKRTSEGEQS